MTKEHPITPPPELVQEWIAEWSLGDSWAQVCQNVALVAARWGADQELEACINAILVHPGFENPELFVELLRAARRPKPPSLKEQALAELELLRGDANAHGLGFDAPAIRRALEALPDV